MMIPVTARALPDGALLRRHADLPGVQSDAHVALVPGSVALPEFLTAFFTSRAFRAEALILRLALRRPTGRAVVVALSTGQARHYAAWQVEARQADQVLMAVGSGPIRSWWMVEPAPDGGTALWFGSAILPVPGTDRVARGFRLLNRFHLAYARFLLRGAVRTLRASAGDPAKAR